MNKNLLKLLGILVIVLIAGILVFKFTRQNSSTNNQNQNQVNLPQAGQRVDAPKGQVIEGFPTDLILNSFGKPTESYMVPYGSTNKQYSVAFQTKTKVIDEYSQYLALLYKDGYSFVNKHMDSNSANIYATSQSKNADVNFTIIHTPGQTLNNVSLIYLKK